MVASVLYLIFGFIEVVLAARLVLLLIGANATGGFSAWIDSWGGPLIAPFVGLFGQHVTAVGQGVVAQSILEWTTVLAIVIYAIMARLVVRILANL